MESLRTLARVAARGIAFLLYLWFAGVHHADEVRRRKVERRRTRRS